MAKSLTPQAIYRRNLERINKEKDHWLSEIENIKNRLVEVSREMDLMDELQELLGRVEDLALHFQTIQARSLILLFDVINRLDGEDANALLQIVGRINAKFPQTHRRGALRKHWWIRYCEERLVKNLQLIWINEGHPKKYSVRRTQLTGETSSTKVIGDGFGEFMELCLCNTGISLRQADRMLMRIKRRDEGRAFLFED